MSHHHFPICPTSGKVRYRELNDTKVALRRADRDRHRARVNKVACSRAEINGYHCPECDGWHLTSQPAQPARPVPLVPKAKLTPGFPGPAAEALRRMFAATSLTTGTAA
jgi:hypothetical protein